MTSKKEEWILEPYFLMKFHGGVSWDEQYDMPVAYKEWFLERLGKELSKDGTVTQDTARGSATPQRNINMRQLQEMFSRSKGTSSE